MISLVVMGALIVYLTWRVNDQRDDIRDLQDQIDRLGAEILIDIIEEDREDR